MGDESWGIMRRRDLAGCGVKKGARDAGHAIAAYYWPEICCIYFDVDGLIINNERNLE